MENGTNREVIRQFDRIASLSEAWNHNRHYHRYLLGRLPAEKALVLDVGCGAGDFCRALAPLCGAVIGIDVSPAMIREARSRTDSTKVEYRVQAAEECLGGVTEKYDAIIAIASLHHMDMDLFFAKAKGALKPGGVLMVLDLYEPRSIFDYALSLFAVPANIVFSLVKNGRIGASKEEKEAWRDHNRYDSYSSLRDIASSASRILGRASIRRHLFWRYSLIYAKPVAPVL
jgi:2-polyprenyl-3-methyl-5-hydroxy-6-metoxy-1,4-benzoquinol methylase